MLLASIVAALNTKTDKVDFTQNSLVAVTALGVITGTPILPQTNQDLDEDINYLVIKSIDDRAKEANDNVSEAILFKDATLISGNGVKYSFKYLHVFISEIIGLALGNMSVDPTSSIG